MYTRDDEIQALKETLIFELAKAFALPQTRQVKALIRTIFGRATLIAAEIGIGLDHTVAEGGLSAGARWLLPRFVKSHKACGVENIPQSGPLVIASNHPAFVDSVVISAYINRPDYKVIIGDIPFFKHLPNLSKHAIYAPEDDETSRRMLVIRKSIRHLKDGGALLIFPRGGIEADPAFMPNADGEFHQWSRSLEIFMQRVPGLQTLMTIVSGVISQSAFRHPITWFRKARPDRQRLAFFYQFIRQMLSNKETFGLTPRVTFGEIISRKDHMHTLAEIEEVACRTLRQHRTWNTYEI